MGFSKECTKCGRVKWWYQFTITGKSTTFSLRSNCKKCASKYAMEHRKRNYNKPHDKTDMELKRKRNKKWRYLNKKRLKEYQKQYYLINKDIIDKKNSRWQKDNKKAVNDYHRKFYKENPGLIKKWRSAYVKNNIDKIRTNAREKRAEGVKNLGDHYVMERIVRSLGLHRKNITPELIELKRQQLKYYRALRGMKDDIRSRDSGDPQAA